MYEMLKREQTNTQHLTCLFNVVVDHSRTVTFTSYSLYWYTDCVHKLGTTHSGINIVLFKIIFCVFLTKHKHFHSQAISIILEPGQNQDS